MHRFDDEALDLIDFNEFGNGAAIFVSDNRAARRCQDEVEVVGMIGIACRPRCPLPISASLVEELTGDTNAHSAEACISTRAEK